MKNTGISFLTPLPWPGSDTYSKGSRVHSCMKARYFFFFFLEGKSLVMLSVLENGGKKIVEFMMSYNYFYCTHSKDQGHLNTS